MSESMQPVLPRVPFETCPIRASLGSLGRKWALLVMRDVAFFRDVSFGQILRNNRGMTPRVLSMRLRDLRREGLIERMIDPKDERQVRYRLTAKGRDIVPILTAFIQYGIRHHADIVFEDEKPRDLERVFPGEQVFMLGRLERYARPSRQK
ncbi:MAG TPA: helix-turn-helix domain-containing protein [Thermoplasmata archaeon]|nr:helix-turn-helix domain-containing protein [Thermoplasmata archaeon]